MLAKYYLPAFSFEPTGLLHAFFTVALAMAGSLGIAWLLDRCRLSCMLGRKRLLR